MSFINYIIIGQIYVVDFVYPVSRFITNYRQSFSRGIQNPGLVKNGMNVVYQNKLMKMIHQVLFTTETITFLLR